MSAIVKELRLIAQGTRVSSLLVPVLDDAADTINRLTHERDEALKDEQLALRSFSFAEKEIVTLCALLRQARQVIDGNLVMTPELGHQIDAALEGR